MSAGYVGRFAPSPSGPLHAGSLVAALAAWLDARAFNQGRGGRWLVRIEDVDTPRQAAGAGEHILAQAWVTCGLLPDEPPLWQSTRAAAYQTALEQLQAAALAYPAPARAKTLPPFMLRKATRTSATSNSPIPALAATACKDALSALGASIPLIFGQNTSQISL